jgi:hypothetical protein
MLLLQRTQPYCAPASNSEHARETQAFWLGHQECGASFGNARLPGPKGALLRHSMRKLLQHSSIEAVSVKLGPAHCGALE